MSMEYIRKHYDVPAKRGGRVVYSGGAQPVPGKITGTDGAHIRIRLDGSSFSQNYHPTWKIEYLPEGAK